MYLFITQVRGTTSRSQNTFAWTSDRYFRRNHSLKEYRGGTFYYPEDAWFRTGILEFT